MPWYKAGTVSVVQNSNAVIGTGTAFIANSRVGDAFRGPDGGWYEVTNIASDVAMSIDPPYKGATNAAGGYALAPLQGYVKDSADALRGLVNTYGAKLAALGTTGNYETLPVTKGGTGIAANTPTDLLYALGAMPAAGGAYAPVFNSLKVSNGASPSAQGGYIGWHETNGSNMSGAVSFTCNQGGGTGGFSWRTVNQANTVGGPFMTYSYAGVLNVPVGLQLGGRNVVESGSNTNGNWVRFADGTQICTCTTGATTATTASGNSWNSSVSTWTYPAAFVAGSDPVMTGAPNSGTGLIAPAAAPSNTAANWVRVSFYSDATGRASRLMAVGRWF
ncbi:phage tail protein [Pseudomonas sp. 10S4]|uniref:phage tail protein n=2 Tax=Pseudomonas sp. 10S4 TaxID=3048583 RepID=UPI002B23E4E0|nr:MULTISPECIES: phage tail protein [unclassified Pseudomonas]MEB0226243.1 phage tail protein [Pseudomonas sp. 5S1]MEB0294936.1 phage tail protein [Pseudomonas sp. 10S4]